MEIEVGRLIKKAKIKKCGDGKYPVLSMTMHEGLMFQDDRFKKQIASVDQSSYQVVSRHQLVESFPIDEGVLAVQELTDEGIVSPAYKIWDVNTEKVYPKYLEYALRSPRSIEYYKSKLRGTTARRRSIPDADFLAMMIRFPVLEVQISIVDAIEKTKSVIELRKNELSTLDDLIKARFVELFGDPVSDSKNWGQVPLKEYLESIRYGTSTPPIFTDDGYAFIRATNIKNGRIVANDMKYIPQEEADRLEKCKLSGGELIIVRSGVNAGDTCVVSDEYIGQYAGYDMILVLNRKLHPVFLNTLINTEYMDKVVKPLTRRAAQPHLNSEQTQGLPIIKVPFEQQKQFADFVKQVDKSKVVVQRYSMK